MKKQALYKWALSAARETDCAGIHDLGPDERARANAEIISAEFDKLGLIREARGVARVVEHSSFEKALARATEEAE